MNKKLVIITTVSDSLPFFKGQIDVLKQNFTIELISSDGPHLHELCKTHEVTGHALLMKREISLIDDLISLFKLVALLRKVKPFIVHGNTPKAGLLSMIAASLLNIPKRIYYVHGLRYEGEMGIKRKILMVMEKISCFLATDVIAVSRGVRQILKDDKITIKDVHLIWNGSVNGIDVNFFNPDNYTSNFIRDKYGIRHEDFVYGFVGRIVGDKGVNELINAFDSINKKNKFCKLLIVGQFEHKLDPLNKLTLDLVENNKNIILVGFQRDIRPFMATMDILVFPSYREGFGIVLMEAGSMRLPAISSDIIGCNEIIVNMKNGFLIKSKNQKELEDKMIFSFNNKKQINEMGYFSRKFFLENYDQKKLWKKSLEFYKEISVN